MSVVQVYEDPLSDTVFVQWGYKGDVLRIQRDGSVAKILNLPGGIERINNEGDWDEGFRSGESAGYEDGYSEGYDTGYRDGLEAGEDW